MSVIPIYNNSQFNTIGSSALAEAVVVDEAPDIIEFNRITNSRGYRVLSNGQVLKVVTTETGEACPVIYDVKYHEETNILEFRPKYAEVTESGTELGDGAMAGEVNPTSIGLGILSALGVGRDSKDANPDFWNNYAKGLDDAIGKGTNIISKALSYGNGANVIYRMARDSGALQAYISKDDLMKGVTVAYNNGALNGAQGKFEPIYNTSGDYQLSGGGASPDMCLAFVNTSNPQVVESFNYRWNIACQGITPDAVTIMHYYDAQNNQDIINCYPYKLDNAVLHLTVAGDTYTVSTLSQRNLGRASIGVRRSDGFIYSSGSDVGHLQESDTIKGTYGLFTVFSTVYSNYKPKINGLTYDPECQYIGDPLQLESAFPDWLANGFKTGIYDPYTQTNRDIDYIPCYVADVLSLGAVKGVGASDQQKAQQGVLDAGGIDVTEFFPPIVLPSIEPAPNNGVDLDIEYPEGITPVIVPPINNNSNKLYTVYRPTNSELDNLGGYLWSTDALDILSKLFSNNPLDAVISLHQIYCTPSTNGRHSIILGNADSNVVADIVDNQYVSIDCGRVAIPQIYNDARDFLNVETEVYLPFISFRAIDPHDVIGCIVNIKYLIDVYTGSCLASLNITKGGVTQTLYTFEGNCSVQIPLTSSDRTRIVGTIAQACASFITGGVLTAGAVGFNPVGGLAVAGSNLALSASNGGTQSSIQRTSGFSGNCGAMAIKKPYIVVNRLKSSDASEFNKIIGYPTNKTILLKDCSGFTRVKEIHLDNMSCTKEEKDMLYELLTQGIEL